MFTDSDGQEYYRERYLDLLMDMEQEEIEEGDDDGRDPEDYY